MSEGGALGTLKKAGTLFKGTLRGLGQNTLRRLKGESTGSTIKKGHVSDAELNKIKDKIVSDWKMLKVTVSAVLSQPMRLQSACLHVDQTA